MEAYSDIKNDLEEITRIHWEEVALNKDKIKLNPDWARYEALEKEGRLGIYTARCEGELVGYFWVLADYSLHYKDHMFAANDAIYLKKEFRKGLAGLKLIKYAEEDLKSRGISVLVINTKVHAPFDKLMERMKYNLIERVYTKYLKED